MQPTAEAGTIKIGIATNSETALATCSGSIFLVSLEYQAPQLKLLVVLVAYILYNAIIPPFLSSFGCRSQWENFKLSWLLYSVLRSF